jgi:CRISPR-associated protein Cas1
MQLTVDQFGSFIGKKSERIRVTHKGQLVHEVPLLHLDHILVAAGGVGISSDAIAKCVENGIQITFMTYSGRPYAHIVSPALSGTVRTRREQLLAYNDERGARLAKAFAAGKLLNQGNQLRYMAKYRKQTDPQRYAVARDAAIELRVFADQVVDLVAVCVDDLRLEIMNLEGRGADLYWRTLRELILVDVEWPRREHQGAKDAVNCSLNYGYGILYAQVESAVLLAGLDPYAGFLHVDRPGKPSLVLDLIEEFRAPVVDRVVFGLLNKGARLELDDSGRLTDATRHRLADAVVARLDGRERYEKQKCMLRTILQCQARHLATFVRGEGAYEPFVSGW